MDEYIKIEVLRDIVNEWGKLNLRDFGWRKTQNPYIILTTEIMLQRTRSSKVAEIYQYFFEKYPSIEILANADITEVHSIIKPLGLKSRAERFVAMAKFIVDRFGGDIPKSRDQLLEIPGVGQYVAGMVQMCAFGIRSWALDTNIIRIISRVIIGGDIENSNLDKELVQYSQHYFDTDIPRETAYLILDFGALVCKCLIPICSECPVAKNRICRYYEESCILKT